MFDLRARTKACGRLLSTTAAVTLSSRISSRATNPADELDPDAVSLLRAATQQRSDAERHLVEAIKAARNAGLSWSAIGTFVGTTGGAARQ